ncbi:hypothetical protein G9A89_000445 [Geosiphon pyriformis]|nr:hypothetical protein G9A89_000445 [Geosiphon pyriformis]
MTIALIGDGGPGVQAQGLRELGWPLPCPWGEFDGDVGAVDSGVPFLFKLGQQIVGEDSGYYQGHGYFGKPSVLGNGIIAYPRILLCNGWDHVRLRNTMIQMVVYYSCPLSDRDGPMDQIMVWIGAGFNCFGYFTRYEDWGLKLPFYMAQVMRGFGHGTPIWNGMRGWDGRTVVYTAKTIPEDGPSNSPCITPIGIHKSKDSFRLGLSCVPIEYPWTWAVGPPLPEGVRIHWGGARRASGLPPPVIGILWPAIWYGGPPAPLIG